MPPRLLSKEWFARYVDKTSSPRGCWIWLGKSAHAPSRAVYALKRGPIPVGLHVRHKCDNWLCVRLAHLELGTHLQNMWDKQRAGTSTKDGWELFIGPRRPHYLLGRGWTRRRFSQTEIIAATGWPVHKHLCDYEVECCLPAPVSEAC